MTQHSSSVLVVEDSRAVNTILSKSIVEQLHLNVVSVFSMAEAMQAIGQATEPFFVAILDLNLPDAPDGEVVQTMLTLGIRPIILTGNMSDELHDEMMSLEIIDYVVKRNLSEMQYVIEQIQRLHENSKRTVLVVDDSKTSRKYTRNLLERHYLTVLEAADGFEGLEILEQHPNICLMIVDYHMPKMNGLEFITKVRGKHQRTEIAIVGMSGMGSGRLSVKMLKSGANDFITRPFATEEFYCRINHNIDAITNYQKLEQQSFVDPQTSLYNRRFLFETGSRLFKNAKRKNLSLTVALIDIDGLQTVNDKYGNKVGNLVLKHVAGIISDQFRDSDIVARSAGDEFCVLCLNLNNQTAKNLFERLRSAIEQKQFELDNIKMAITVSIGYTLTLQNSFEAMVIRADKCLYKAKTMGYNRAHADIGRDKPD